MVPNAFAVLAGAALALPALTGTAAADDTPISIYFVGCAAPTGLHGRLARGTAEAGKNLGVNALYLPGSAHHPGMRCRWRTT